MLCNNEASNIDLFYIISAQKSNCILPYGEKSLHMLQSCKRAD